MSVHRNPSTSRGKIVFKTKAAQNQVCEVRLIPGLYLVCFWEYRPMKLVKPPNNIQLVKFTLKDTTGYIPRSVRGEVTKNTTILQIGDCVTIQNGIIGSFNKQPTLNLNASPKTDISVSI